MSEEKQRDSRPKLSVLIATVTNRAAEFAKLHAHLLKQAEGKPVEILFECDNKEISIGAKRQKLLERATGDYIAYIDDDDWCSDEYVNAILRATVTNPDCIGFEIRCIMNGIYRRAIASMRYKDWCNNRDGYDFCRSVYHKTPARRELALKVGFKDLRYGEDKIYSVGVMHLVKSEVFIPEQLYIYRFSSAEPFLKKYGIVSKNRDYKGRPVGPVRAGRI